MINFGAMFRWILINCSSLTSVIVMMYIVHSCFHTFAIVKKTVIKLTTSSKIWFKHLCLHSAQKTSPGTEHEYKCGWLEGFMEEGINEWPLVSHWSLATNTSHICATNIQYFLKIHNISYKYTTFLINTQA